MKLEDIEECDRSEYKQKCDWCGKEYIILSQRNDHEPEYYTNAYLKCICDEYVYFRLPVN